MTTKHWLDISMLEERRKRPEGRRRSERRQWWWLRGSMRAKAIRISGLEGSSPPMVVQGLSLLLLPIMYRLLNDLL
jgi:hypothetical protein